LQSRHRRLARLWEVKLIPHRIWLRHVVTLNAGSSSIKFGLFANEVNLPRLIASGQVEGIGADSRRMQKEMFSPSVIFPTRLGAMATNRQSASS
jgi:hypothetical protein